MGIDVALAYGVGLIAMGWFAIDSSRIPSMIWYWSGFSRSGWWASMGLCFVGLGIPAVAGAIAWRFSDARKVLLHEFNDLRQQGRAARESRVGRSPEGVA